MVFGSVWPREESGKMAATAEGSRFTTEKVDIEEFAGKSSFDMFNVDGDDVMASAGGS